MDRTKGMSLAKGPVGIIGIILLAGGILGLLFGSTSFTAEPPDGSVSGGTWLGIEGNGWTWVLFAGSGLLLLLSAPLHWGAKTMALIVGIVMGAAALLVVADGGGDAFGIFAANDATTVVFGVAAVALLFLALLPRVGRRPAEAGEPTRTGRFRRRERAAEPAERERT